MRRGPLLYGNSVRTETSGVRFSTVFNYRVCKSFAYDGRVVAAGEVLDGNSPLVRDVLASRPDLLDVERKTTS
jgi:hypothetical protein